MRGGNISQLKKRAVENTLARQGPVRYTILIKMALLRQGRAGTMERGHSDVCDGKTSHPPHLPPV